MATWAATGTPSLGIATTTASLWLAKAFSRPAKTLPASARPGNGNGYVSARKVVEVVIIIVTVSFRPFGVAVTCVTLLNLEESHLLRRQVVCDLNHCPHPDLRTYLSLHVFAACVRHFSEEIHDESQSRAGKGR